MRGPGSDGASGARSGANGGDALCEVDEEATPATVDSVCTSVFKFRFGSLLTGVAMDSVGASDASHRLVSSAMWRIRD